MPQATTESLNLVECMELPINSFGLSLKTVRNSAHRNLAIYWTSIELIYFFMALLFRYVVFSRALPWATVRFTIGSAVCFDCISNALRILGPIRKFNWTFCRKSRQPLKILKCLPRKLNNKSWEVLFDGCARKKEIQDEEGLHYKIYKQQRTFWAETLVLEIDLVQSLNCSAENTKICWWQTSRGGSRISFTRVHCKNNRNILLNRCYSEIKFGPCERIEWSGTMGTNFWNSNDAHSCGQTEALASIIFRCFLFLF